MNKIALVNKYLPYYRLAVFNKLSLFKDPIYEIVGGDTGREGIRTIPVNFSKKKLSEGGIRWSLSRSIFYHKSLQLWQTNVVSKMFSKEYNVFILDGAISHISTWIFTLLAKISGKKVIFWSHGLKGTDTGIKKEVRHFFFKKLPDALLLYGDFSKSVMEKKGFDSDRMFVIGNSLDYDLQKRVRTDISRQSRAKIKEQLFKEDLKTVIFIGRLVENKKVDQILKALFELRLEGKYLNCIIVGDGPELSNLLKLVSEYEMEGYVSMQKDIYDENEIAKLFYISDLMVSPGNVGLNCIHSLSYGVPVLTHDNFQFQNPEVEAIEEFKNGILFKHGNFIDMKEKIKIWFQIEPDNVKDNCINIIEKKFNPVVHAANINRAVKIVLGYS